MPNPLDMPSITPERHDILLEDKSSDFKVFDYPAVGAPGCDPSNFPRIIQGAKFNLFGHESIPISLSTLYSEDALLLEKYLSVTPVYEAVKLERALKMGDIFGLTKDTVVGAIEIDDIVFVYQNMPLDLTNDVGFTILASLNIGASHPDIRAFLSDLLGVQEPSLDLSCNLPIRPDWSTPLSPSAFKLTTSLFDMRAKPFEAMTITSLSFTIERYIGVEWDKTAGDLVPKALYHYSVKGAMELDLSFGGALAKPIYATYMMVKGDSSYGFEATFEPDWVDAFGMKGLLLSNVYLSARFNASVGWKSVSFSIGCSLVIADTTVSVYGSFSFAGDFELSFHMENLTWDTIIAIHRQLYPDSAPLVAPDIGFSVESVTVAISKQGLFFQMMNLEVGDYPGASATLQLGSTGGRVDMSLSGGTLEITDSFKISEARIRVDLKLGSAKAVVSGKKTFSIIASGKFAWQGLTFSVGGRIYTHNEDNDVHYTIYGSLGTDTQEFQLGKYIKGIKDSFLGDLAIQKLSVIVASRADSDSVLKLPKGCNLVRGTVQGRLCKIRHP